MPDYVEYFGQPKDYECRFLVDRDQDLQSWHTVTAVHYELAAVEFVKNHPDRDWADVAVRVKGEKRDYAGFENEGEHILVTFEGGTWFSVTV